MEFLVERFAVRPASPVRPLRCETGFACEMTWQLKVGGVC